MLPRSRCKELYLEVIKVEEYLGKKAVEECRCYSWESYKGTSCKSHAGGGAVFTLRKPCQWHLHVQ